MYNRREMAYYSLSVKFSQNGKRDNASSNDPYVVTGADQCWKQHWMGSWTEYIPMDLFPTILVTKIFLLKIKKKH